MAYLNSKDYTKKGWYTAGNITINECYFDTVDSHMSPSPASQTCTSWDTCKALLALLAALSLTVLLDPTQVYLSLWMSVITSRIQSHKLLFFICNFWNLFYLILRSQHHTHATKSSQLTLLCILLKNCSGILPSQEERRSSETRKGFSCLRSTKYWPVVHLLCISTKL
jgi:hypothetical protein